MKTTIAINGKKIGPRCPVYIVAEMSANHNQSFDSAVRIIEAAKEAGADAIKLQTYTPETLTLDCRNRYFRIQGGAWEGRNLYDLYKEAATCWEWQPKLKKIADELGLEFFSTPFDPTAVDFLERMDVSAYKVASFELVDLPLLKKIAGTGKPVIMSTGMASLAEIDEAVQTVRKAGGKELALLKCTSAYPAPPGEMNLRTIPHMCETFGIPAGLSDHTLGFEAAVAAVSLGAAILEKHLTLTRKEKGPDSAFSMEPHEFKSMVRAVRNVEKALGKVSYKVTKSQTSSHSLRRSLFVVQDMKEGDVFTEKNVRSIRPGFGLHTRYLPHVLGKKAVGVIKKGTPLQWDLIV